MFAMLVQSPQPIPAGDWEIDHTPPDRDAIKT
jgi:hypothetical protein